MPTIKIGNFTTGILQPEQPIHLNPDGSAQATLTYKMAEESADAVIPAYNTPYPLHGLSDLKCFESDLTREAGGIVLITSIYRGVMREDPDLLGQHEGSRAVSEAPIETHPIFALPRDNPPVTPPLR